MIKYNYPSLLLEYINAQEPEQPILTDAAASYVALQTSQEKSAVKRVVNVNMARLTQAGHIDRIAKGVYCRRIPTAFGYYTPNKEVIFCRQLLYEADHIIGYETGLSAMNRLGLISQMPRRRFIATNLYTKKIPADIPLEVRKPPATVCRENHRYLQLLDVIEGMEKAPVDTARPAVIIKKTANELCLNTDRLILMARKYYSKKTLLQTIDIMLEE